MGCKLAIVAPDLSHNGTLTVVTFDYFQLFFFTQAIKYVFNFFPVFCIYYILMHPSLLNLNLIAPKIKTFYYYYYSNVMQNNSTEETM